MTTKNIISIHGAWSTPLTMKSLELQLPEYNWTQLSYAGINTSIPSVCDAVKSQAEKIDPTQKYHVVGHSLGGLMALYLADYPWVESITTISSPTGGLNYDFVQLTISLFTSSFPRELTLYSSFIKELQAKDYTNKNVSHVISTSGYNPLYFGTPNDGVITIYSQQRWTVGPVVNVNASHIESLNHPDTINHLKSKFEL